MYQIIAREFFTFKTKPCFAILKSFACFDFTSNTGDWLISIWSSATDTFVVFSQIGYANPTVHSARGYERCFI